MVNTNIENIQRLFEKVKKETNNFTQINEDYIKTNPKALKIFRILAGLRQEEFKKNIDSSISDYEYGRIKQLRKRKKITTLLNFCRETIKKIKTSDQKIEEIFQRNFEEISFPQRQEEIKNKIRRSVIKYISSINFYEILEKASRKETIREDEKVVLEYLKNIGISSKEIEVHKYLGKINIDLFIPSTKTAIFVTSIKSTRYSTIYLSLERIALRSFRLKKNCSQVTSVGVVFVPISLTPHQLDLLQDAFDIVCVNDLNNLTLLMAQRG